MNSPIRILIADDHALFRRGLVDVLAAHSNWTVCAQGTNGREALEYAKALKPDIAILDLAMPELDGLSAARIIREESPNTEILILSMHYSDQLVRDIRKAGIKGFLVKTDSDRDLITAVQALMEHKTFFIPHASGSFSQTDGRTYGPTPNLRDRLTPREREIVALIARGERTTNIAVRLKITERTVNTHRHNIRQKLSIHSLGELVLYAIRNKLIEV